MACGVRVAPQPQRGGAACGDSQPNGTLLACCRQAPPREPHESEMHMSMPHVQPETVPCKIPAAAGPHVSYIKPRTVLVATLSTLGAPRPLHAPRPTP
eukprot:scaffold44479_cov54-Phaeocystis_antarctica.AAC.2